MSDIYKGLVGFCATEDLDSFEENFLSSLKAIDLSDHQQALNLLSSIWIFGNQEWKKGFDRGTNNPTFEEHSEKKENQW